jgi:hypothetical protein
MMTAWGILWRSDNQLDGYQEHLMGDHHSRAMIRTWLFETRAEARKVCEERYGYISRRADLRAEPHGWKPPKVVKVKITIEVEGKE